MIITFREILRRAGARLSNTGTSVSEANDLYPKMKDWGNERYERIYDSYPWKDGLEQKNLTIVLSQTDYGLDRDIGKIWSIYDSTNGQRITTKDVQQHDRFYAEDLDVTGNVSTGDPSRYSELGHNTVKVAIAAVAEKMSVVSSDNTTDITPNVVHLTGLVDGVELSEDVVLTGTTAATSANTYDASQKLRVSVGTNDATRKTVVGIVTVSGNTSSTVFAQVSPSEIAPRYKWIRVSPTPKTSGTQPTWRIQYSKRLQHLVSDNDIPILDVGLALIEGIVADGLREDGQDAQAGVAEQMFVNLVSEKMAADRGPNDVEQFVPEYTDFVNYLDYGRVIGS